LKLQEPLEILRFSALFLAYEAAALTSELRRQVLVIFITPDYTRWQWFSVPAGVIEIARTPGNIEVFCSFLGL
jgi:hypothetical protein